MPTISELSALAALSKLDKFEVERAADNTSYSVTAQDIATFVKTTSNGGFRGSTTKSINDFTIEDVGMWYWVNGETNPTGLTAGVVEIISSSAPDEDNVEATFIQRLSFSDKVYQRMYMNGHFDIWGSLTNSNGAKIQYGNSTDTDVTFPVEFADVPAVVATPINANDTAIYFIQVYGVSRTGFQVKKWVTPVMSTVEQTVSTESESGGTTTKSTTTTMTGATWEAADDAAFNWIALSDVGG